jgi:hypothetical protein
MGWQRVRLNPARVKASERQTILFEEHGCDLVDHESVKGEEEASWTLIAGAPSAETTKHEE